MHDMKLMDKLSDIEHIKCNNGVSGISKNKYKVVYMFCNFFTPLKTR